VITRCEPGSPVAGIKQRLREYNARAPIFCSRVKPLAWVDGVTGETEPLAEPRGHRVAAFCGLANPASFWRTLAGLNCRPVERWALRDHHHYRPWELRRMAARASAAGAELLLTTEKDFVNLPAGAPELLAPLRLLWLRIGMEVEKQGDLLRLIQGKPGKNFQPDQSASSG
jgi:tetraacyldisaccharide-1-P 4'-kinase